jgi:hypothetical protein
MVIAGMNLIMVGGPHGPNPSIQRWCCRQTFAPAR